MWSSNFNIYIDPSLKIHDKLFTSKIEVIFEGCQIQNLNNFEINNTIEEKHRPVLIVNFNSDLDFLKTKNSDLDKTLLIIQYKKSNLDLLIQTGNSLEVIEVQNIVEFEDALDLIRDFLFSSLELAENAFLDRNRPYMVKQFSKISEDQSRNSIIVDLTYDFRSSLIACKNFDETCAFVSRFFEEHYFHKVSIIKLDEMLCVHNLFYFLPLVRLKHELYFLIWNKDFNEMIYYYSFLDSHLEQLSLMSGKESELENWENIKNSIEIPMLLLDTEQNVLGHNNSFIELDLSLNESLHLENNEQVTIKDNLFRVLRSNDLNENTSFLFFPVDGLLPDNHNPSSEELGIISSSIAHELNNPLAGVMAALEYIHLDNDDVQMCDSIQDMRNSVTRCKKLVETFLGFSRYKTIDGRSVSSVFKVQNSMQQAFELMRSRLVENNLTAKFSLKTPDVFSGELNPYVMSMIFYLVLGEVVTGLSHLNLLRGQKNNSISIEIYEYPFSFSIKIPEKIDFFQKVLDAKLIKHLCDVERINLRLDSENTLVISIVS